MAVVHISEAEAANDFKAVMDRVRAGDDVRIDSGGQSVAMVPSTVRYNQPRLITDVIAGLERRGSKATLPQGFASAVEEGIRAHEHETLTDPWE